MKKYILGISLMFAVIVIAVAACSKSNSNPTPSSPTTPTTPGGGTTNAVSIKNFAFSPASITIKKGQSVTWTNEDSAPHTATEDANAFDSGSLATGAKYSRSFDATGTYTYHCTFHSSMVNAKVIVTD
ncbi:cupredoxin family copper-binding protein [Mucilaginibacter sp. 21P]|uniref:cupredoxin domain-containing protein n=1 Tax=Mucilaginibacter sp. 21P TaxID=2778902 RepID=UPI001C55CD54|nr:cupredoxin family copper-binding protein [Mucilaginibacter sp. 21P]QXV65119.1 cupredoxin family copper-binding protein [Mucilaginibacter sp. 21P]